MEDLSSLCTSSQPEDGSYLENDKDWQDCDIADAESIATFFKHGCSCKLGRNGNSCISNFEQDYVYRYLSNCRELSKEELDLAILGQLCALSAITNLTFGLKRKQASTVYRHGGFVVCQVTFAFMHGIGKRRLENLQSHFLANGLTTRQHGNAKRLPHNVTTDEQISAVKTYIENHGVKYGLCLPGRVAGRRDNHNDVQMLPSFHSRAHVHRQYMQASKEAKIKPVSYKVFNELWENFLPNVVAIAPRSDMCFQCQEKNHLIIKTCNSSLNEKSNALRQQQEHLLLVDVQIQEYNDKKSIARASRDANADQLTKVRREEGPCRVKLTSMYSFDFAQLVHYPSDCDQPGAIYFKAPRKCAVFGINNEATNRQTNYLTDEALSTGKGANTVISYIHHYLEHHGDGETNVHFQADNCAGQNKNNIMMQYLCYRVAKGLHHKVTLDFMVAGHTKFSVDRGFGVFKKHYNRKFISSIFEVAEAVNMSGSNNIAQLVGLPNGDVIVPVYDWTTYFKKHFRVIPNITKYHHFRFDSKEPGVVHLRHFAHTDESQLHIMKSNVEEREPEVVPPQGLTLERKNYLYNEIRRFCKQGTEDLCCPKPL